MFAPSEHTRLVSLEGVGTGQLPDGWAMTTLGECCFVIQGQSPPGKTYNTDRIGLPFLQGKAEFGATYPIAVKWCSAPSKIAEPDDVLVSVRAPVGPTNLCAVRSCIGRGLAAIRTQGGMPSRYILYALRATEEGLRANSTGTTFEAIRGDDLRTHPLPLPPLPEQRRIVAEIEKQFTLLDAAVAALKRVQANLKRYRSSVLRDACEGRLVPAEAELARAEGRDYEAADKLLERILAERRAKWESQKKRRGKYKEPAAPEISGLPDVPEGWVWATVGQLATIGTGSTPLTSNSAYYQDGLVPWVTSSALNDPVVSHARNHLTPQAVEEYRLFVYPEHTLLVAMYGEGKTRGKCSELMFQSTINQAIAAIVMEGTASDCRPYSKVFLHANYEATRRLSSGGVQPNLNLGLIKGLEIPFPPIAEQFRIVAEVERRLSVIQQAEATVETNLVRADRMRQSILKQAFSGKLVAQDPNDEPASVLLERIRVEREAAKAAAKAKRKPRPRRARKSA